MVDIYIRLTWRPPRFQPYAEHAHNTIGVHVGKDTATICVQCPEGTTPGMVVQQCLLTKWLRRRKLNVDELNHRYEWLGYGRTVPSNPIADTVHALKLKGEL